MREQSPGTATADHLENCLRNGSPAMDAGSPTLVERGQQGGAAALEPLRQVRQAEGSALGVVDLDTLCDEYNFGEPSLQALRAFIHHAWTSWQSPPRYVLLVGDATYDPRHYLLSGIPDYVPTKLVATIIMETASDDWFVDFNDDGMPELVIGRLPVRTIEAAQQVVTKLGCALPPADASRVS
jgi:Peptidase family C25